MSYSKLFLGAFLLTTFTMLGVFYHEQHERVRNQPPVLHRIAEGVFVTSQLKPTDLPALKSRGIRTVVDQRPDGEAADQTPSAEMEMLAKRAGFHFRFVPIPHEAIPADAVDQLTEIINHQEKPVLLYCRTGRRAVRTFALAEASRENGPVVDEILGMARRAGFPAEDLRNDLIARVAHRKAQPKLAESNAH